MMDFTLYRLQILKHTCSGIARSNEHVKSALYLEEDLRLETALRRMQRGGQRLAIVLARDRREIGILSLQDVLRVIFGEVSL